MRPELRPARTVSAAAGEAPVEYRPWVEVTIQVRAVVPSWGFEESSWVHWALPIRNGSADIEAATQFDPGRRAAIPGEPPEELRSVGASLDRVGAARLCDALLGRWQPRLHFHSALRIVSRLDEPLEGFRRRCVQLLGPFLRSRGPWGSEATDPARLATSIESRTLTAGELEVVIARFGLGWYPRGVEPVAPAGDPLMLGDSWGGR